jgi:hypothetical protein
MALMLRNISNSAHNELIQALECITWECLRPIVTIQKYIQALFRCELGDWSKNKSVKVICFCLRAIPLQQAEVHLNESFAITCEISDTDNCKYEDYFSGMLCRGVSSKLTDVSDTIFHEITRRNIPEDKSSFLLLNVRQYSSQNVSLLPCPLKRRAYTLTLYLPLLYMDVKLHFPLKGKSIG